MVKGKPSNITMEDLVKYKGESLKDLATRFNVSVKTVTNKRKEFGLSKPRSSSSGKSNKVSTSGLSSSFPNKKVRYSIDPSGLHDVLKNLVRNSKKPWNYVIYWHTLLLNKSLVLKWGNGYIMEEKENRKMIPLGVEQQRRQDVFQSLRSQNDPQQSTNEGVSTTEWSFLTSMTKEHHENVEGSLSMVPHVHNGYVWIAGRRLLSTSDYTCAREGAREQLKTMVFIPILNQGVVELGSTELIFEDADLIKHVKGCLDGYTVHSPTKENEYEDSKRPVQKQRLNFKATYGAYKHKFHVSVSEATLACVMEKVGVLCNLTIGTFMLTYLDEERDTILLQTELAMEDLIRNLMKRNVAKVELEVALKQKS